MSRLLSFAIAILIYTNLLGQSRQITILQLEKDRFKAMINKDSMVMDRVFATDLLYIHSNGVQDSKETLIQNIMNDNVDYIAIDLTQADVRTANQLAWVHGAAKIKVRNGKNNPEIELSIRYLDIYKREDGEWKLVAWQSAKLN
jgi:ketosteroid isomerase-like protein